MKGILPNTTCRPSAGISAARHALSFSDTCKDSVRLDLGTIYEVTDSGANSDRSTKVGLCDGVISVSSGPEVTMVRIIKWDAR